MDQSETTPAKKRNTKVWWLGLVVLVLVAIVSVFVWEYLQPITAKGTPQNALSCMSHGGTWNSPTPPFGRSYCSIKMSDGGKHCQTTTDCRGICQPVYENYGSGSYAYRTDYGQCSDSLPVNTAYTFDHKPITNVEF